MILSVFTFLNQYSISELAQALYFPADISIGGTSWTLERSGKLLGKTCKQQVRCLVSLSIATSNRLTFDVKIKVLKIHYSFLNHI